MDGRLSELVSVISGVPQGTVSGPCLFLIHLMDIANNLSAGTTASSFADDTRLQHAVESEGDCENLQQDHDSLYSWAESVWMLFNAGKFELLRFWQDRINAPDILYLAPDRGPIEEKDTLRDLGVMISTNLTFHTQIAKAVQAGSLMAGWALRSFRGRGKQLMLTILRTLIQPRLDYCSHLWSPTDQLSINQLESVQKGFILKISDAKLSSMDYCTI